MIQKVNEACPGDCASCEIAQSLPNFDYTFCMTYQMFRKVQSMGQELESIKSVLSCGKNQFAVSAEDSALTTGETDNERV